MDILPLLAHLGWPSGEQHGVLSWKSQDERNPVQANLQLCQTNGLSMTFFTTWGERESARFNAFAAPGHSEAQVLIAPQGSMSMPVDRAISLFSAYIQGLGFTPSFSPYPARNASLRP